MARKHALQKLIESSDTELKIRSYSGRGMFGKQCLGIDVERGQSIGDVFAAILEGVANDDSVLNGQGLEEAAEAFRNMSSDNMGLGTIYYFPNVRYIEDEEQDDLEEVSGLRNIQIMSLSREGCVELLEHVGIQCYDSETVDMLREAVRVNVADGTIAPEELEAVAV
jgi:ribosome-binding factor A